MQRGRAIFIGLARNMRGRYRHKVRRSNGGAYGDFVYFGGASPCGRYVGSVRRACDYGFAFGARGREPAPEVRRIRFRAQIVGF
jgi:hypothetical protein